MNGATIILFVLFANLRLPTKFSLLPLRSTQTRQVTCDAHLLYPYTSGAWLLCSEGLLLLQIARMKRPPTQPMTP